MKEAFKNLKKYLKLPEVRVFWLFVISAAAVLVIDILFLDRTWALVNLGIILVFGAAILAISIKGARASVKLRLEKTRLDNIIASMTDGVIIYDQDFKVLLFSGAAESIFDLKASEVVGQKLTPASVSSPKLGVLAKIVFQSLAPVVVRQSPEGVYPQIADISFEEPHQELRVITDRIMDEDKEVMGFLKIVHDRTRSVDLLKSKSDFITIAAHQLRTPLSAINWSFQEIKKEASDNQKDLINSGLAAANNLVKIVEDLLNISKIEEGRFGYNFKRGDLVSFLQAALNQAAPVAKEYGVKVYMEPPKETSIMLEYDSEKLSLVLSNILENAIKYNVENGQVVVSVQRRADAPFVQVDIADTGIGISEETLKNMFTKFYRGDNAMTKETAGSGLGLYIAKNVIKRHGGQIWADSVVDRGTTVHFTLPTDSRLIPQKEISRGEI